MALFNDNEFRVYTKYKEAKKFQAVNVDTGQQVGNLIHASIMQMSQLKKARKFAQDLVDLNETVIAAEIRDTNGKTLYSYEENQQ